MRLIDADELIERIDTEISNAIERGDIFDYMEDDRCHLIAWLQTTPTAYDVDKVVEELENEKTKRNDTITLCEAELNGIMDKAIDIVKRGGVDDIQRSI